MRQFYTIIRVVFFFLTFFFSTETKAQCSITASVSTGTLSCGTAPLRNCGAFLYVGDGTNAMTLTIDSGFNLSCLGPINLVVRNKAILLFGTGANDRITLAEGSSITVNSGGRLDGGDQCTASDRIYIGEQLVSTCNGQANSNSSFSDLESLGGTGAATSNSPVCVGSVVNLAATPPPNGVFSYSWTGPNSFASTAQNPSFIAGSNAVGGVYKVVMTRQSDKKVAYGHTTVVVNSSPVITTQPSNQLDCEKRDVNFKVVATGSGLVYSWQYKKPGDLSFTSISSAISNVSNYDTNVITVRNVGSAQFPNGTQFQAVVSNGICSITSSVATLSVNELVNITSPALTPAQSIVNVNLCYGASYSYTAVISNPSNGPVLYKWKRSVASGVWTDVVDGTHFSGASTATLNIINGTPAESAEYRVYVTFNNTTTQCSVDSSSRTRLITFLPQLTSPQTTIVQPDCMTATGSIRVEVQSETDSYSFDNGANYQASNIKSALTAGNYKILIKNSAGCVSTVADCVIKASVESKWNGNSWFPNVPTASDKIVFEGNYSENQDLVGCSCEVKSGAVVIPNGRTLTLTNGLTVSGGSLTFDNNSSLVQIADNAINMGNIIYRRNTAPVKRYDFTYWSSPVAGQALHDLSPNTLYDKYYSFNPDKGWVIHVNGNVIMDAAIGYSVRAPQNFSITVASIDSNPKFIGVPNNGIINVSVEGDKSYLIGNPYPSAIDADEFLIYNSAALEGTLYFWTHNSPPSSAVAGNGTYNYTVNDYASYNLTGGIKTAISAQTDSDINDPNNNNNLNLPTGKIAAGQAFFASSSISGGLVSFNNSMRIPGGPSGNDNAQFFRFKTTSKSANTKTIEKNRIWLNLANQQGAFKQTLIGYISGATNTNEGFFDGISYDGNQFVDFYSINENLNLSIQGRALPFQENDTIRLGYKTSVKGDFQISIDRTDGQLASRDIFLEDKLIGIFHDLKKEAYSFTTEKGVFNDRFVLRYNNKNILKVASGVDDRVSVLVQDKVLKINSRDGFIDKIVIYDVGGSRVFYKGDVNDTGLTVSNVVSGEQVLIVNVVLQNGTTVSKKIIY
ncbi:hypothetical protein [Flavobacterium granuli]|uniref:T9SS sorting signal type C domain-containing protein n=1 Tax=Flavobacterium granuli TaxID=280093 RepID=A0A1M5K1C5_9FLAO|nr:hypothetical protein [Flavobacterium granuli]PRZ26117.1 hypothetical protein BC624_10279 [Flavobacterium granuli]SHG46113.1 hypothetical protein SAMN05443373_10279 [Flavobacterium granuli]